MNDSECTVVVLSVFIIVAGIIVCVRILKGSEDE